jgi:hypothetical protein
MLPHDLDLNVSAYNCRIGGHLRLHLDEPLEEGSTVAAIAVCNFDDTYEPAVLVKGEARMMIAFRNGAPARELLTDVLDRVEAMLGEAEALLPDDAGIPDDLRFGRLSERTVPLPFDWQLRGKV